MKAEEKVAEAMHRLLAAERKAQELNIELDKANVAIENAREEVARTCHAVFGGTGRQVIYEGFLWDYQPAPDGQYDNVPRKPWNGVVIGNGKDAKAS